MKRYISFILFLLSSTALFSQQNARNGADYSPTGLIRMFVVFADIVDDPYTEDIPGWEAGHLPRYADSIIDASINGSLISHISKFFQETSFGGLQVVGDYYPELLAMKSC